MLSGLCIRFEWWLFLFSTCQPPGQLPTVSCLAWSPDVCASRDERERVCVCVCVCVCVRVQVNMSMLRVGAGPAEKNL